MYNIHTMHTAYQTFFTFWNGRFIVAKRKYLYALHAYTRRRRKLILQHGILSHFRGERMSGRRGGRAGERTEPKKVKYDDNDNAHAIDSGSSGPIPSVWMRFPLFSSFFICSFPSICIARLNVDENATEKLKLCGSTPKNDRAHTRTQQKLLFMDLSLLTAWIILIFIVTISLWFFFFLLVYPLPSPPHERL